MQPVLSENEFMIFLQALRFASDEELGELLERAIHDRLPPTEIKRAIKRWRADLLRT